MIVDVGWDPDVGVHANVRAIAGDEDVTPSVFALDDSVLITAK